MSNWFPPPSRPRPVDGGLKARSTRGAIAQTWWSQRFIEVLEGIGMGSRLQRGRSYARKGQVHLDGCGPGAGHRTSAGQPGAALPGAHRHRCLRQESSGRRWRVRWPKTLGMPPLCSPARCRRYRGGLRRAGACRCSRRPPGSCRWTAPARMARCRASTLPRRSTCWPSRSTMIRSPSSLGADASVRTCWRICRLPGRRGRPAADRAEPPGRPLTDCLDSYFIRQADVPSPSPRVTSSTALLDQLPDVVVGVRGRPLVEILRPAYAALGEGEGEGEAASGGDRPV